MSLSAEGFLTRFSLIGDAGDFDGLTRVAEVLVWIAALIWIFRIATSSRTRTSSSKSGAVARTQWFFQRGDQGISNSSSWEGKSSWRKACSTYSTSEKFPTSDCARSGEAPTTLHQRRSGSELVSDDVAPRSQPRRASASASQGQQGCGAEEGDQDRYVKLLKLYCKNGGGAQAMQLLTEMKNLGTPAPQTMYVMVMMACAKELKWRTVLQLFQELQSQGRAEKLTTASYTVAIDACAKSGKWEKALELMQEMLERGPKPDALCWHAAMHACAKKGRVEQALHLLEEMVAHGEQPDVVTCSAAINACANAEDCRWEQAIGLLERMQRWGVRPNVVCYSVAIKACAKSDQWPSALELLEAIRERGLQRNVITYNAAIDACAKGAQWQKALELLEEMRRDGLQPNATSCNSAIKACARGGQCQPALELLNGMRTLQVEPDVITYNEAMSACANCGDVDRALELLREMRRKGLHPDTVNHNVVIRGCAASSKWSQALELLRGMQRLGPKPNITSYYLTIDACVAGNATSRGLELMQEMWQQGLKATGNANQVPAVVRACAAEGHQEMSLNCWQEIRRYDVRPYAFISKVIKAHVRTGATAKAKEFVEELRKQGLRPNANVCGPAFTTALDCGTSDYGRPSEQGDFDMADSCGDINEVLEME